MSVAGQIAVHENCKRMEGHYRERLREIEDLIRDVEDRTGQGSNVRATLAAMTDDEWSYLRRTAIVP